MGAIRVERGTAIFGASEDVLQITLGETPGDLNWFVKINNSQRMATGPDAGTTSDKTAADMGAAVTRVDIETFQIARRSSAENVDYAFEWEAWIYQAGAGDDNELVVQDWQTTVINGGATAPAGDNPVPYDSSIGKVVPIILAIDGRESSQDFSGTAVTAEINTSSETVEFRRAGTDNAVTISYALVEFKGTNWSVALETNTFSGTASTTPLFLSSVGDWANTIIFSTFRNDDPNQASLCHAIWPSSFSVNLASERIAGGTALSAESYTYLVENADLSVEADNSFDGNADDALSSDSLKALTIGLIASGDAGVVAYAHEGADTNDWPQANWAYRWASPTTIEFERSRANGGAVDFFYQVVNFSGLPYTPPTPEAQSHYDLTNKLQAHYAANFAAFATQSRNLPFVRPDTAPWVNLAVEFSGMVRIALSTDSGRYRTAGQMVARYYTAYKEASNVATDSFGDNFVTTFSDLRINGAEFERAYLRVAQFDEEVGQYYYEFVAPFTWTHSRDHSAQNFAAGSGYQSLYGAVNGRYETLVETPQGIATEYGNLPFNIPSDLSEWCRVAIRTSPPVGGTIGEREIPGAMIVQLFQPIDTGDATSLQLADTIVDKFVGGVEESVTFGAPSIISVGNDGYGWWQTNVSVPFLHLES